MERLPLPSSNSPALWASAPDPAEGPEHCCRTDHVPTQHFEVRLGGHRKFLVFSPEPTLSPSSFPPLPTVDPIVMPVVFQPSRSSPLLQISLSQDSVSSFLISLPRVVRTVQRKLPTILKTAHESRAEQTRTREGPSGGGALAATWMRKFWASRFLWLGLC